MKNFVVISAIASLALIPALAGANDSSHPKTEAKALTGCLGGPNSEGAYTLKTGSKRVEVGGSADLKKHVGHEVKLTGTWAKASDIGEKETSSEKGEKKEHHFKVDSIEHVSDSCSAKDAESGMKSGH